MHNRLYDKRLNLAVLANVKLQLFAEPRQKTKGLVDRPNSGVVELNLAFHHQSHPNLREQERAPPTGTRSTALASVGRDGDPRPAPLAVGGREARINRPGCRLVPRHLGDRRYLFC
jgi:hypothetical protein